MNDKVGRLLWAWFSCPTKSADKIGEHGRYFCLLLRTISASTTAERSQNSTCITFFCI